MLYRYQLKKNGDGILVALDNYFTDDEVISLGWIFEAELAAPDIDMYGTVSYFTQAGNKKFHKAIRKIITAFSNIGIEVERLEVDPGDLHNIVYQDRLQVVCKKKKRWFS